jgi:hypothetical protein
MSSACNQKKGEVGKKRRTITTAQLATMSRTRQPLYNNNHHVPMAKPTTGIEGTTKTQIVSPCTDPVKEHDSYYLRMLPKTTRPTTGPWEKTDCVRNGVSAIELAPENNRTMISSALQRKLACLYDNNNTSADRKKMPRYHTPNCVIKAKNPRVDRILQAKASRGKM